ncbi:Release factor glutamine methyltransferase [Sphaceloma murrayae]|uniref:Release factor glutamine methyltransferase n=1 Tax=Sphaceloma murrayae TaxID=2082308 RepID=A0A2K1QGZ4_9PEZI|nr:Release factor glutamine methyltransferase [Sphaceloma murrayae]
MTSLTLFRWETASTTEHLANIINRSTFAREKSPLKILDLCSGTGCILLLLRHLLGTSPPGLAVQGLGIDVSDRAVSLARRNADSTSELLAERRGGVMDFRMGDIFDRRGMNERLEPRTDQEHVDAKHMKRIHFDVLVSNPPYVSPKQYRCATTRSVRLYEPEIALVPPQLALEPSRPDGPCVEQDVASMDQLFASMGATVDAADAKIADRFYPALLVMAVETGVKMLLFEVGDAAQAARVVKLVQGAMKGVWHDVGLEIWRDEPGVEQVYRVSRETTCGVAEEEAGLRALENVLIRGRGNIRAVFAYAGRVLSPQG